MLKGTGISFVELSAGMITIGLITAGIQFGGNMMRASQANAAITHIQQLDSSVTRFRDKYRGLPGDMTNPQALIPGCGIAEDNCVGGNGDGRIYSASGDVSWDGEIQQAWQMLSNSGLIDEELTADNYIIDQSAPETRFDEGGVVLAYTSDGNGGTKNVLIYGANDVLENSLTALSPEQAHRIDSKLDDAMPNTGAVQVSNIISGQLDIGEDPTALGAGTALSCITSNAIDGEYYRANEDAACNIVYSLTSG